MDYWPNQRPRFSKIVYRGGLVKSYINTGMYYGINNIKCKHTHDHLDYHLGAMTENEFQLML